MGEKSPFCRIKKSLSCREKNRLDGKKSLYGLGN
jgi:hypothetical protein